MKWGIRCLLYFLVLGIINSAYAFGDVSAVLTVKEVNIPGEMQETVSMWYATNATKDMRDILPLMEIGSIDSSTDLEKICHPLHLLSEKQVELLNKSQISITHEALSLLENFFARR